MLFIATLMMFSSVYSQRIKGTIYLPNQKPAQDVMVFLEGTSVKAVTGIKGQFTLGPLEAGSYRVVAFMPEYQTNYQDVVLTTGDLELTFRLEVQLEELEEVVIQNQRTEDLGISWLESVSGTAIYEGKKTELIQLDQLVMNKATNVSRQVYSRVPGLNIWENDGAGIQLGIGGRGLNPNRTSNFNVRQNGYDISADALGYPESYYTPPVQALDQIEIVRGAAGLQYGTQFGGMLNFRFKDGPEDQKIQLNATQTVGSFGLFNTFNSVGGTVGKVNYYGFFQHKQSDGWRPNSGIDLNTVFGSVRYDFTPFFSVKLEHTHMSYEAQQPGGLTDLQFFQDPRQSNRTRNWFQVGWDLSALEINYRLSSTVKFNNKTFVLGANRYAVGNLGRIDRPDDLTAPRNLLKDNYANWGNEFRVVFHYPLLGQKSVLLLGNRLYHGRTDRAQGDGDAGNDAYFQFSQPEDSRFQFPSRNVAFFAENIFNLGKKWSVTPGIRYEYIQTDADGYYLDERTDLAGNVIYSEQIDEYKSKTRSLALVGVGVSYKYNALAEVYGNFSQNFRSINFNDIRVDNPSLQVDPNIDDERGYNLDLGIRGNQKEVFRYDVSLFYLSYRDRIGNILQSAPDPRFNNLINRTFRYRTNIADAGIVGLETYGEANVLALLGRPSEQQQLSVFLNLAYIYSSYLDNEESSIQGNKVELVPPLNVKSGITYNRGNFGISYLISHVTEHFSDASNTDSNPPVPTAVEGIIPTYTVMDLSMSYDWKIFRLESGINNLNDAMYYTRRAAGYPGPGIIPSDGRSFYLTLGIQL